MGENQHPLLKTGRRGPLLTEMFISSQGVVLQARSTHGIFLLFNVYFLGALF